MSEFAPLVYVDIRRALLSRIPGRPQRWYWIARSADNQKKLARSTERYTNREDCVHAIKLLFAASTTVYLRRREADGWPVEQLGNEALRMAA
jgi:uncharacterized protein YegP (UPF0339 family)